MFRPYTSLREDMIHLQTFRIFTRKGHNVYTFLFTCMHVNPLLKWIHSWRKQCTPDSSKYFPFRVDPDQNRGKQILNTTWENVPYDMCAQRRLKSVLPIRTIWSETSLSAWGNWNFASLAIQMCPVKILISLLVAWRRNFFWPFLIQIRLIGVLAFLLKFFFLNLNETFWNGDPFEIQNNSKWASNRLRLIKLVH